ncbi:iron ABC transporter ATP-binding protein [Leifsonia poae]|uniref:iron ABC transporter ATP-binding protein n=1 Tax=Leifsonia poae TaxID=110933 RepID=UPI001CBAFF2B|nr:iron ABC transporter ATP-binding protein [Leifsonia poae]
MLEPTPVRASARTVGAVTLVLAGAMLLSGCVGGSGSTKPTATPSATATTGGGTNTTPTPTPTPSDPPTPLAIPCDQVITPDQLYAFNPNFGTDPGYAPKASTLEQQVADWKGTTCAWLNQTSGETIEIAVAKPPASAMEGLKNAAVTTSQPVPTYGVPPAVEGYFKPGTAGEVQIFTGSYWIVATSTAFSEPGDPAPLMQNVLANLPKS